MPPQIPGEDDLSLVPVRRADREKDESEALARCRDYEANEARKTKETECSTNLYEVFDSMWCMMVRMWSCVLQYMR